MHTLTEGIRIGQLGLQRTVIARRHADLKQKRHDRTFKATTNTVLVKRGLWKHTPCAFETWSVNTINLGRGRESTVSSALDIEPARRSISANN